MAQPTGQVNLAAGHASEYFWYANDTGLYDSRAGAAASKTGSAVPATESGALVMQGNASTYFTTASTITLASGSSWSLGFKARESGGTNSMVCGDATSTGNFLWLNNGSAQLSLRASGTTYATGITGSSALHVWWITKSGTTLKLYKDGAYVSDITTSFGQDFTIKHVMAGYSGAFNLQGALEFLHVVPGTALDDATVSSYSTDPYQVLAATTVTHDATGALTAQSATAGGSAVHNVPHDATGALTADAATLAAAAIRNAAHPATGDLVADAASLTGSASRSTGATTHDATGALTADAATLAAAAIRNAAHPATGDLVADAATLSGTATRSAAGTATIVTPPIKNNTGTLYANINSWAVNVYDASTGAFILRKTGLTTSSDGRLTIADAALVAGTTYTYEPEHAVYGRRLPTAVAA